MNRVTWTLHPIAGSDEGDGNGPLYAILPDDGTNGLLIGEFEDVAILTAALERFIDFGRAADPITDLQPQLGAIWLTPTEASQRWNVPYSTITLACRDMSIQQAEKRSERGWHFPQRTFLAWLAGRRR